ncbi:polyhydroxyalkanoic acid system family protein [Patescibacteria group bacterium]|nr:polyhydroxyalkanoic acid system family protein [Patescibacteria group bacterium]
MHIQVPNKFGTQQGIDRVKSALEQVKVNPQVKDQLTIEKEEWEGNKLTFAFTGQGQHISGTLVVDEKEFIVDAKLPLMLRMFEGRIEKMIGEQVKQML